MASNYQLFLDALNQLEQDQTLYEAELGGELTGIDHEEVVHLGALMTKRFRKFAEKGETFADTLSAEFIPNLTESMQLYQNLMVPPKVCGGLCACLKPARDGPEYDRKLLTAKAKMISSIFVVQAVLIENRAEQHNMDSMHYADYVNKMNVVFNALQDIKCKGSEKSLDNARKKLLTSCEQVERFIQHYSDSHNSFNSSGGDSSNNNNSNKNNDSKNRVDFKNDALRRVRVTQELLNSRVFSAPSSSSNNMDIDPQEQLATIKRTLVKAQSNLQEIMNSSAAIAFTEAKENLGALDSLAKLLKKIRDSEVQSFNSMEERMNEFGMLDDLSRLREYCELIHSDANSKIRDAIKRWTGIKNQAVPRKVAEYEEDNMGTKQIGLGNVKVDMIDPQKIFNKPVKQISDVGKIAEKFTLGAVSNVSNVFTGMGNEITNAANVTKQAMTTSASTVITGAKKVFTGDEGVSPANSAHGSGNTTLGSNSSNGSLTRQKSSLLSSFGMDSGEPSNQTMKRSNGIKYTSI